MLAIIFSLATEFTLLNAQVPPNETWHNIETDHFSVTFPLELESQAKNAAAKAENAFELLNTRFVEYTGKRIELLITDHTDSSNGYATPIPYNTIVVYVRPPMEGNLSHFDDWMDLLITHELTHILQFDRSRSLGNVVRRVFGSAWPGWPAFPGLSSPTWIKEGLATYYESVKGSGRLNGTFFDTVLRTEILENGFQSLDQMSGISPNWPTGSRNYIYGAVFMEYLRDQYGEEKFGEFVNSMAGQWLPVQFLHNSVAKNVFGISFSDAWSDWHRELSLGYRNMADSLMEIAPLTSSDSITSEGYFTINPRVSPDGESLAFVRSDGRSDVQLRISGLQGENQRKLLRLSDLSDIAWFPDGTLVASRMEFQDTYRLRSGLIRVDMDGSESWISKGSRLHQPTVSPDGKQIMAVQDGGGTNRLVHVDVASGAIRPVTSFNPLEHWAFPAWSPDGRWLAVSRWQSGGFYDLVVMDSTGSLVHEITKDRAVDRSPAWSPDGRWILWSSDRNGMSNIYAVEIDLKSGKTGNVKQITNTLGGFEYPSVSSSGKWIYFSSYHREGWKIARISFDTSSWFEPLPRANRFSRGALLEDEISDMELEVTPYKAAKTIRPRYWYPIYEPAENRKPPSVSSSPVQILGPGFGISTGGSDLVGRHAYGLGASVRNTGQTDLATSYRYSGLANPLLTLGASQNYRSAGFFPIGLGMADEALRPLLERERRLGVSSAFLRRHTRNRSAATLSASYVWEALQLAEGNVSNVRTVAENRMIELGAVLQYSTARSFAFSMGVESGFSSLLRIRTSRQLSTVDTQPGAIGVDRSFDDFFARVSMARSIPGPGFSNHVASLKLSFGAAKGTGADSQHFTAGGTPGNALMLGNVEVIPGRRFLFPIRGYFEGVRAGKYAWAGSAEYRVPLKNVDRGLGLVPSHLDRVSGSVFLDGGNAWGVGMDEAGIGRQKTLLASGVEIQSSVSLFFTNPLFLRAGYAVQLDQQNGRSFYFRLGTIF